MVWAILCIGWAINALILVWIWMDARKPKHAADHMVGVGLIAMLALIPWSLPVMYVWHKLVGLV